MSTGSGQPKEELLPSNTTDQLYTTHDISRLLQVDPSTVSKWIDRGILMAFRTPGGHRRVRSADLRTFLITHQMPGIGRASCREGGGIAAGARVAMTTWNSADSA